MEYLIVYDIASESAGGSRRLRRVAKICEGYGQRVQKSVFECLLNSAQLDQVYHALSEVVEASADTIRFYRLAEPLDSHLRVLGRDLEVDFHRPIIL